MELLFLDTYYIDGEHSPISLYLISKDFIVPSMVLILTVLGSFCVARSQINAQRKLENEKQRRNDQSIVSMLKSSIPKMISSLRETIKEYEEIRSGLGIGNKKAFNIFVANTTLFESIVPIGYDRFFSALQNQTRINDEEIVKLWSTLSNVKSALDRLMNYSGEKIEELNVLNRELNRKMSSIAMKCTNIIHDKIAPFSIVNVTKKQVDADPKLGLALATHLALEKWREDSESSRLKKNKALLEDLDKFKNDFRFAKILDGTFAQEVADSLGMYGGFEHIFGAYRKTIDQHIDTMQKMINVIERSISSIEKST